MTPRQQSDTRTATEPGPPCGLPRRLAIMVYDALVIVALLMFATALALLAGFDEVTAGKDLWFTLYLAAVWFLYLAGFWRHGGMTVGMRAWRVVIVDDAGRRPGWWRCLLRFVVSWLSAALAGAGFLWSLFEPRRRTWHDLASRTRLLRTSD